MQLELKINALSVHSNLGSATHRHLGLFITNTKYTPLSSIPCVRPVHPCILLIPNNSTRVALYKLKWVYKGNLIFFTNYMDLNKHWSKYLSQPPTKDTLSPWRIVLLDNLRETLSYFCIPLLNVWKNITNPFKQFRKRSDRYALWPLNSI